VKPITEQALYFVKNFSFLGLHHETERQASTDDARESVTVLPFRPRVKTTAVLTRCDTGAVQRLSLKCYIMM